MDAPARILTLLSREEPSKEDIARSVKITAVEYDAFIDKTADVLKIKLETVDVSNGIALLTNARLATFCSKGR